MKRKKHLLLIIISFISIGFAVLTSNLSINGIASFTDASFDVHFENATIKDKNIDDGTITIGDDTVSITSTGTFEKPGNYIDTSFYVMNSGTMDASLNTLSVSGLTNELKNYFAYTLKYDIGGANVARGDILKAGQGRKINLHIEYKYDVEQLATVNNLNITITMNYINPKKASTSTVWDYEYTGGEQYFIAQKSGNYKLEVWGAQGGSYNYTNAGGYGGYSTGIIHLIKNNKLYINVGGQGEGGITRDIQLVNPKGGYNGGGNGGLSSNSYHNTNGTKFPNGGAGGGATHIAFISGTLSRLTPNNGSNSNIVIVSGGGGGAGAHSTHNNSGGGQSGSSSESDKICATGANINVISNPGTQDSGFAFGQGQDGKDKIKGGSCGAEGNGGGGGGYYGGYSYSDFDDSVNSVPSTDVSGGGGSGYIGNTNLTDKIMYCYNCQSSEGEDDETNIKTRSTTNVSETPTSNYAKIGDGFVKITYLGKN